MRRRLVLMVVVCLLAGVVVNVLVAWGCAWLRMEIARRNYATYRGPEAAERGWPVPCPPDWPQPNYYGVWRTFGFTSQYVRHDSRPAGFWEVVRVRAGFPARSLASTFESTTAWTWGLLYTVPWRLNSWRYGWQVPAPDGEVVPLPLVPLWRGFLVNTLFYALLVGASMTGMNRLRRRRRRRRGRCVQCAYDLGGLATCPECGTARSSHGAAT